VAQQATASSNFRMERTSVGKTNHAKAYTTLFRATRKNPESRPAPGPDYHKMFRIYAIYQLPSVQERRGRPFVTAAS